MILMHEVNAQHQHRILLVADDESVSAGEWAEERELAQHAGFYANLDPSNGLPPGVFKVWEFAHQVVA